MRLTIKIAALFVTAFFFISPFVSAQSGEGKKLTFKESLLTKIGDDGRMVAVHDGVFRRGETVNLVLLQVKTFQKGTDGKHRFDIDMLVKGPAGDIILDQKSLLGENGHALLKDGIAASPYGIFETHPGLDPGTYQMTLTIYDKISGAKAVVTKSVKLSKGLSYQRVIFARRNSAGRMTPVENPTFSRGEIVGLIFINVGKFKKGPDGHHNFNIDMEVENSDGKQIFQGKEMLGKSGHLLLKDDIAQTPHGKFYTSIEMDPGIYRMTVSIYDKISGERLSVTKPFRLK